MLHVNTATDLSAADDYSVGLDHISSSTANGKDSGSNTICRLRCREARMATGLANGSFTMTLAGATTPGTVDINTASGSATLVYQVDRPNAVVSISAVDITSASGPSTLTAALAAGTPVKVFGTPQADGTVRAYALIYFTGTQSTD